RSKDVISGRDATTGAERWTADGQGTLSNQNRIVFLRPGELTGARLATGDRLWHRNPPRLFNRSFSTDKPQPVSTMAIGKTELIITGGCPTSTEVE
ncbi:MAG: hypothetical protein WEB19_04145, partial [Acidimicrobiia bacterium]